MAGVQSQEMKQVQVAEGGGVNPETRKGKTNLEKPVTSTSWESRRTEVQSLGSGNNHKGRDE